MPLLVWMLIVLKYVSRSTLMILTGERSGESEARFSYQMLKKEFIAQEN